MQYKVCILAAGRGTRLSTWQTIHKALLPVGNQAVISRIIEKFPKDIEIVIPCGYKSDQLKDFISIAHPDRKVIFVDVDKWEGEGSGPGYSLLACKNHLSTPFIFTGADTLVTEPIPEPTSNWIGVAPVTDTAPYLAAEVVNGKIKKFHDKVDLATIKKKIQNPKNVLNNAFIGIAGVHNWQKFWDTLAGTQTELVNEELQVANGLHGLIREGISAISFTWYDTGNDKNYRETNKRYPQIVAPKPNEQLYIQNNQVIKFFADKQVVKDRVKRAKILKDVVPPITKHKSQFYSYNKVPGKILSDVHDVTTFSRFLEFCQQNIWQPIKLSKEEQEDFITHCSEIYRTKTKQRVDRYLTDNGEEDKTHVINGRKIPKLRDMLAKVDWDYLAHGTPVLFHGDPQPENVIVTPDDEFALIDWRQNFAGLLNYGDLYYDLLKIDHALPINGEMIRRNNFQVSKEGSNIMFEFQARSHLLEYREILHQFILDLNYDLGKVKLLTALTYLNIAPLHHSPYNELLYYLGKYSLYEATKRPSRDTSAVRQREDAAVAAIPAH